MKTLYSFIPVLLILVGIGSPKQVDPVEQARVVLEQVSETYRSYKTMSADFELKIENLSEDIKESKTGKFLIKGEMFNIDMGTERVLCNGKVLWTHLVDLEEVQLSDYDPEDEDALTPNSIFKIYEDGYNYRHAGEVTEDGVRLIRVDLFPQDKDMDYYKIELSINKAKMHIASAKIFDKNGNRYTYSVSNLKINKEISDTNFFFDKEKYQNVEEIDLRG